MTRDRLLGFAVLLLLLLVSCSGEGAVPRRFSLAAAGDALIHKKVYTAARKKDGSYDFRPMLRLVKSRISAHDLAFYNQETLLGGKELGLSTYPRFNSPREVGDAFLDAGFNLVSLANNHTLDRGEKGVLRSLEYWKGKNQAFSSGSFATGKEAEELRTVKVNGITCAFFAYTTATNGLRAPKGSGHYVSVYTPGRVEADIKRARGKADVVIVSMHWGSEYVFDPTPEQIQIAAHLASLGVNLVIGHHPHVVQPVKMVGNTLVIYSLGNFLSGQDRLERQIGLLVSLDVVKTEMRGETRVSFENVTGTLLYNPRNSPFGRHAVIPFDMLKGTILKGFPTVHKKYAAYVKKSPLITMRAPASEPVRKKAPPARKRRGK